MLPWHLALSILYYSTLIVPTDLHRYDRAINDSQCIGDYRSVTSGDWGSGSTWERWNGSSWAAMPSPPDSSSGIITIRSGHTVRIGSPVVYDQLVVESGAQVTVASGVNHTLGDGPGVDLTIYGVWLNQGGTWTIAGGASWTVKDGGTFIQNTTSGLSSALSKASLSPASRFVYRGSSALVPSSSFSARTYGTLSFESSAGKWTCTATGSSALNIKGDLVIGAGVLWNTPGFSGIVTVEGKTEIEGEWSGGGSGNLGLHTFVGPLTVGPGGKYALATTGSTQGDLVFKGDLLNSGSFAAPDNRLLVFSGSSAQNVAGIVCRNLTITNSCGIVLLGSVEVDGTVRLNGGNLTTGPFCLILGPDATLDEGNPYSVVGTTMTTRTLSKGAVETFGNMGLEILTNRASPGLTKVIRTTGVASSLGSAHSILRFFDIEPTCDSNLSARVMIRYQDKDLNGANASRLSLFKSVDSGTTWTAKGGSVDASARTVTLDGVDSFSRWTAGEIVPEIALSGILPSFGERGSSLDIQVIGSGFIPGETGVSFEGSGVTVRSASVNSSSLIIARIEVASDAPLGLIDVSAFNSSGKAASLRGAFEIRPRPNPVPRIILLTPSTCARGQSLRVVARGGGFVEGVTSILLGEGVEIHDPLILSDSLLSFEIVIDARARTGPRLLAVTNSPPGGGTASLQAALTVLNPLPVLSGVTPDSAFPGDSLWVTINGSGFFNGVTSVSFSDGIAVDSVAIISCSQLVLRMSIAKSAIGGQASVSLTNCGPGGGTVRGLDGFTINNPLPKITCVAPPTAQKGKTVSLTISGSDFIKGVTTLKLGGDLTVDSVIVNPTQIKANVWVPRVTAAGSRVLTVTNPWPGGGSSTLLTSFSVLNPAPLPDSLVPNKGSVGQRIAIQIRGSDLWSGPFGVNLGPDIAVDSIIADTSGAVVKANIAIPESASVGSRDVIITNPGPGGGSDTLAQAFMVEYPSPTLVSATPPFGWIGQTMDVRLEGANFISRVTKVGFGLGVTVNSVIVSSPKTIVANISISPNTIPAARSVTVSNSAPGGGVASLPFVFNVDNPAPTITGVVPPIGMRASPLTLVVDGTGFLEGKTLADLGSDIGIASTSVISPTQLRIDASVPSNAKLGLRDIFVANPTPGGGVFALRGVFSVQNPMPNAVRVNPDTGSRGERLDVRIFGSNFIAGATNVDFGRSILVHSIDVNSATDAVAHITILSDADRGRRNVNVSNAAPGGGSVLLREAFTVGNPVPVVSSVSPLKAGRGSILRMTFFGSNFVDGATTVDLGSDISASDLLVRNQAELQANVTIGAKASIGTRAVAVTNAAPCGGTSILDNAFEVTWDPPTGVDRGMVDIPTSFVLREPYPNPFNPSTRIVYGLPEDCKVTLTVHNILGNSVAAILDGYSFKGMHEVQWVAENVPSGVYLVRFHAQSTESTRTYWGTKKMVLVR